MSTQTTDADYDDDDNDQDVDLPEPARKRLRALEKENRQLKSLESENAELKQKEAVRTAGIKLNDVQFKALQATHSGESTPEALRKTAEALGFAAPVADADEADVSAHEQLANARTGAGHVGDTSYEDEMATARNVDEAKAIAVKHNRPWAG